MSGERDHDAALDLAMLGLAALQRSVGLDGAAIVDLSDSKTGPFATHEVGRGLPTVLPAAMRLMRREPRQPSYGLAADRRPVLVCPWTLPPDRPGGLVLWRGPEAGSWSPADAVLAASNGTLIHLMVQYAPANIGVDRLTGLLNRSRFLIDVDRHIERLGQDELLSTMIVVELGGLKKLRASLGTQPADLMLLQLAALVRDMVRPGDLVARISADALAVFLIGMDQLTAAERAEALAARRIGVTDARWAVPSQLVSVGIATFAPGGRGQDAHILLRQAYLAAYQVRKAGGGGWLVAKSGEPPE